VIGGLPEARIQVRAWHDDLIARPAFHLVAAGTQGIHFVMVRGGIIRGRVIDTNGTEVVGAWVSFESDESGRGTATAERGRFELRGLRAMVGDVVVHPHEDPVTGDEQGVVHDVASHQGLAIEPGQIIEGLEIVVPFATPAAGRVVDLEGRPCEGILVEIEAYSRSTTDDEGRFHLAGLRRGARVRVIAPLGSIGEFRHFDEPPSEEIVLRHTQCGIVLGTTPPNAEYLIAAEGPPEHDRDRTHRAEGEFQLALWPGTYRITITDLSGQPVQAHERVVVHAGETVRLP
jgi:protocatechuate 3,4-dioxygenase beta subunit